MANSRRLRVLDAKLYVESPESNPYILNRSRVDEAGDKICIFGFSRGAYTARALAGM